VTAKGLKIILICGKKQTFLTVINVENGRAADYYSLGVFLFRRGLENS